MEQLVLCWGGDHTHLAPQFDYFGRTHRVVAVDLRGHGASDMPMQEYTVAGFADDLAWLCDQLGVVKPVAAHRRVVVAPAARDAVCLGAAPAGLGR